MYFLVFATDYDGTLAEEGVVSEATLKALRSLKETGRKLLMVTGREMPDLARVFPQLDLFDKVVAENGALLFTPATKEEKPLAPAPSNAFVEELKRRYVAPLSVGRSIVATWEPHETTVLEVIKLLGLELEIVFNKGAVMVLPSGVNKATGLIAALDEMGYSAHNVVGIGDAENDHAFLRTVGCGVAVANALPTVKETADRVTRGARGEGVVELIKELIAQDAHLLANDRHSVEVGADTKGVMARLAPYQGGVLLAGSSGIGKSTLATALTERFVERWFQFAVLDPEGDYQDLDKAVIIGDPKAAPVPREVFDLLERPSNNVVVNTLAIESGERPAYFAEILPELVRFRGKTGRPHWIIVDEAHHLLPAARDGAVLALPKGLQGMILITVHPEAISPDALGEIETVIALGPKADEVIKVFCRAVGEQLPKGVTVPGDSQALFWRRTSGGGVRLIEAPRPRQTRQRHTRKYAEGKLGEDKSFYFRGPDGELNLRAYNLMTFLELADGVDDETWQHHLRAGDYSKWFSEHVKDNELAREAAAIEADTGLGPKESRAGIAEAVRRRYTAPATPG
jgi:HAD superfamily hydrolase (TIGR01484 family)